MSGSDERPPPNGRDAEPDDLPSLSLDDGPSEPLDAHPLAELLGDRYTPLSRLGEGTFGEVFRARDGVLGREVAVKRVRLEAFNAPGQLEEVKTRFLREAQVAARLRHPNIVTTHDIVSTPRSSFIVMELVEGRDLLSLLQERGRLGLDETLDILGQVAAALDHAHASGVVHRDVKPANVMIEPSGQVKVMDFGIAKVEQGGNLTATGLIMGTPNYMSPEQAKGGRVDARADVFSLGCVLYECLSGRKPFPDESLTAILLKVVMEPAPPLDFEGLGLPRALDGVLRKAMAKEPGRRFASPGGAHGGGAPGRPRGGGRGLARRPGRHPRRRAGGDGRDARAPAHEHGDPLASSAAPGLRSGGEAPLPAAGRARGGPRGRRGRWGRGCRRPANERRGPLASAGSGGPARRRGGAGVLREAPRAGAPSRHHGARQDGVVPRDEDAGQLGDGSPGGRDHGRGRRARHHRGPGGDRGRRPRSRSGDPGGIGEGRGRARPPHPGFRRRRADRRVPGGDPGGRGGAHRAPPEGGDEPQEGPGRRVVEGHRDGRRLRARGEGSRGPGGGGRARRPERERGGHRGARRQPPRRRGSRGPSRSLDRGTPDPPPPADPRGGPFGERRPCPPTPRDGGGRSYGRRRSGDPRRTPRPRSRWRRRGPPGAPARTSGRRGRGDPDRTPRRPR